MQAPTLHLASVHERRVATLNERLLLVVWSLFWLLMMAISIQEHVIDGHNRLWEPLVWEGTPACIATVLALFMLRYIAEPNVHEPVRWLRRVLLWIPALGVVFIVTTFGLRHGIYRLAGSYYTHEAWSRIFLYEMITELSPQTGAAYGMKRETMLSPLGLPCNPPAWGMLHAIDMRDGSIKWQVPLGTTEDIVKLSQYVLGKSGTPNFGGPIVTAGGVVFIGAAIDNYLCAFEASSGKELWRGRLPAGGQATPMTYVWKGRQYVVIAAGGHAKSETKKGDTVIAFALPTVQ
jgi:hypothetical protein